MFTINGNTIYTGFAVFDRRGISTGFLRAHEK